jgi:hypothetical protein
MLTAVMSSGGGKMKGVVKRNGREKMTAAGKMSGTAAKIKKGSYRKNAAA